MGRGSMFPSVEHKDRDVQVTWSKMNRLEAIRANTDAQMCNYCSTRKSVAK